MPVRRAIGSVLGFTTSEELHEVQRALRDRPPSTRVDALEERIGKLERQLALVLDVVQGAARDAGAARKAAEEALTIARRAEQRAASAIATAESAADGVAAVEEAMGERGAGESTSVPERSEP